MGTQSDTGSNVIHSPQSPDGVQYGRSATDLVGFWGVTPVAQPTGFTALTDTSGGVAAAGTGIQALTSTYNSNLIINAISTLGAAVNNILSNLRASGIVK